MNKPTHDQLVLTAERWLWNTLRCRVVLREPIRSWYGELPDAIGWKYEHSILIECKTNRPDFLRDRLKVSRRPGGRGLGSIRYYLTPPRLVKPDEVPQGWGLLESWGRARSPVKVVQDPANLCGVGLIEEPFQGEAVNWRAEQALLLSALSRIPRKELRKIYKSDLRLRLERQEL